MRGLIVRNLLRRFAKRYDYDVSYLRAMFEHSPRAFFRFSKVSQAASYHEVTPPDAYYAAKIVAALHEDCGPCTQLCVNMALEAGVGSEQVAAILAADGERMSEEARLGFEFASALCKKSPQLDRCRDRVRARWGEQGVIELSMCVAVGRVFPVLKAGLGFAHACSLVEVDGQAVPVARDAA